MRADGRLENPGDPGPESAREAGEHDADDDVETVRQRVAPVRTDPDADDDAHRVLTLAADVEEAAAEREGDGEAGERERRRAQKRLREVERREVEDVGVAEVIPEPVDAGAFEDPGVGVDRVRARREDDEPAHEEREDGREERAG